MNEHPTELMTIGGEVVPIDVCIVPVIKWLNDLPGIRTQYCCQGDYHTQQPYVMFWADDLGCLERVLSVLHDYCYGGGRLLDLIDVRVNYFHDAARFVLYWPTPEHLSRFVSWLNRKSCGKSSSPQCETTAGQSGSGFIRCGTNRFEPSLAD